MIGKQEEEAQRYYPPNHLLLYYEKMLEALLERVEHVQNKIVEIKERK